MYKCICIALKIHFWPFSLDTFGPTHFSCSYSFTSSMPAMHSFLGRGRTVQLGVTVCCLMAFLLFGYDQGVFGGILENKDWLNQFDHPSDSETGIIVSCYNLGCFAGCIGTSKISLTGHHGTDFPSELRGWGRAWETPKHMACHGLRNCWSGPSNFSVYGSSPYRWPDNNRCRHRNKNIDCAYVSFSYHFRSAAMPRSSSTDRLLSGINLNSAISNLVVAWFLQRCCLSVSVSCLHTGSISVCPMLEVPLPGAFPWPHRLSSLSSWWF